MIFLCHVDFIHGTDCLFLNNIVRYWGLGGIGVELFIVMSGFVMTLGYWNKFTTVGRMEYVNFIINRISRIYPIYFIFLMVSIVYMWNFFTTETIPTSLKFIIHLLLLQTVFPATGLATAFNGAAWTLATLFVLYLITPFIFRIIKWNLKFFLGIFGVYVLAAYIVGGYIELSIPSMETWFFYFSPFFRIVDYIIGIIGAIFFLKLKKRKQEVKWVYSIIECIALFMFGFCMIEQVNMWILRGVCLTIIMVFSFQNGFISKYLSASFWSVLGEISFSFYLIHYLVLMWVTKFILMNNLEKNVFVSVAL